MKPGLELKLPGTSSSPEGKAAPAAASNLPEQALRDGPLETISPAPKPGEMHTEKDKWESGFNINSVHYNV